MQAPARSGATDAYGHRAIWAIAAPMIVSSLTVPLVGLVGTGVIGHLDDPAYLAAAAAGTQIFSVLFLGLNFLRMGTTGVTAQAFGAADGSRLREALAQAVIVALALGLLIVVAQWPIREVALWLLGPESRVADLARHYYDIRVFSAPAALFNLVAVGWLIGMQNARGALIVTLVINLTNIVLDLWFVLGLTLDVRGIALGALCAEFAGAASAVWLLQGCLAAWPGRWRAERLRSLLAYTDIFRINGNLFVRTLALMFTFGFITAQGARMGSVFLAVNAVLMNFQWLLSYSLDGLANAAEALVGKAAGALDRSGLTAAVRRALAWSLGFAAAFTAVYAAAGESVVGLLTDLPEIRAVASDYLPWLVMSPVISVWSFYYDGVFVGLTRSREMRIVMTGSALLVFLPAWYLTRNLGNHGLWLAFTLFMAVRGLGMHLWYRHLLATDAILQTPAPRLT